MGVSLDSLAHVLAVCVTVTARRRHEPPLVLSRLSAPDVTVASAVLATVAMPFLIPAQSLECKGSDGELRPWAASASAGGGLAGLGGGLPPEVTDEVGAGGEWRDGSIVHDTPREQLAQHFGASYTILHQCNPHVVPLFIALRPTAGQPAVSRLQRGRSEWRGGFALSALLVMLLSDAHKWLTVMRELEIMPLLLDTDWSNLFLQQFTGDVTIYPPMKMTDYLRILSDPTPDTSKQYLAVGQRECWRKMPMLATRLRIANALRALKIRSQSLNDRGESGSLAMKRSDSTLSF
jgi:predicted acylesterase/phospholipase RssA